MRDFIAITIIYILTVNIYLFILMWLDKKKAEKQIWRVKERKLWLFAFSGGALGGWASMKLFRHKTKHRSFKVGFPLLGIFQLIAYIYIGVQFYT